MGFIRHVFYLFVDAWWTDTSDEGLEASVKLPRREEKF
jgi:hypothetical protein